MNGGIRMGGGRIPVTVVTLLSMWNIESGCFDVKM